MLFRMQSLCGSKGTDLWLGETSQQLQIRMQIRKQMGKGGMGKPSQFGLVLIRCK